MLVAREEIRLSKAGVKSVNFELFRKFQGRSADAIKCLRRSAKYKAIRDRLTTESEGALTDWLPGGHEHGESMEVVCEDEAVASDPTPRVRKGRRCLPPIWKVIRRGGVGVLGSPKRGRVLSSDGLMRS